MDISEAIKAHNDGVVISLDVSAGSKKTIFPSGYNKWRNAFSCRINAQPVEGKANKKIISAISDFFSVRSSDVFIVSGTSSSLKRVFIKDITIEDATAILKKSL